MHISAEIFSAINRTKAHKCAQTRVFAWDKRYKVGHEFEESGAKN
jgi:hypothetical protein